MQGHIHKRVRTDRHGKETVRGTWCLTWGTARTDDAARSGTEDSGPA